MDQSSDGSNTYEEAIDRTCGAQNGICWLILPKMEEPWCGRINYQCWIVLIIQWDLRSQGFMENLDGNDIIDTDFLGAPCPHPAALL